MHLAKKRFGQHFLTDPHKAQRLIDALQVMPGETVLEIGPGTGILTERLLIAGANLVAVEFDRDLIPILRERFSPSGRFSLIEKDIIAVDPSAISPQPLKILGNLPYNISGAIVEWFITYHKTVELAVITVQKEVAVRLRAKPCTRDYGSLSVMAQSHFEIKRLFDIPPGSFSPKPKIMSTVLSLRPDLKIGNIDYPEFRDFLRACFAQKRKKLANSLASRGESGFSRRDAENLLARLGKKADIRAEQLSLGEFLELFKLARNR
jgi:16S rRNA (adenine1518-N6/adenine1519-N6)-dimethyltransferase